MDNKDLIHNTIDNLIELNKLNENELELALYENKSDYYNLLMTMASIINKTCGNLNKIYEKTTELSTEISPLCVINHVKNHYGADLKMYHKISEITTEIEVKSSVVQASIKLKAFFKNNQKRRTGTIQVTGLDIGECNILLNQSSM